MKNFTLNQFMNRLMLTAILLAVSIINAQDIHFTFANAQNTNDGSDDYYEVDVMIQTINSTGTFKLGSGQLYFTYNTAAFGTNVYASGGIEVTYPDGYICGQGIDLLAAIKIYSGFTTNDNTTSRVSWAFSQNYSSSTFAANNVTETPAMLCHIKVKYTDVNQDPMFMFEEGGTYLDQFYTACGPVAGGPTATADCGAEPGIQLFNDTFDNGGATLSNEGYELLVGVMVYPNPVSSHLTIKNPYAGNFDLNVTNELGQQVLKQNQNTSSTSLNVSSLSKGLYFLNVNSENGSSQTIKFIKN